METVIIRPIEPGDNITLAAIIRSSLSEFGITRPGTVSDDPSTDDLYTLFKTPESTYFVAVNNVEIVGGAGIFPSPGLPEGVCELVKMYLVPNARGSGLGKRLIGMCLEWASHAGYKQVYLETMPELKKALGVYEKFGFVYLEGPMGNTGHFGCDRWMLKTL